MPIIQNPTASYSISNFSALPSPILTNYYHPSIGGFPPFNQTTSFQQYADASFPEQSQINIPISTNFSPSNSRDSGLMVIAVEFKLTLL
jgi:hypothetical protein